MKIARRPWTAAIFLLLVAAWFVAGGIYLALLGGSPAYVAIGLGVGAAGVLLARGSRRGIEIYWAVLFLLYLWALAEAGFDGWALAPRLIGPTVIGLLLLTPFVRRKLGEPDRTGRLGLRALGIGTGLIAVILIVGAAHLPGDYVQAATGKLAAPVASQAGAEGEWPVYAGDAAGSRFSRLTQIGPANVKDLKVAWTARVGMDASDLEATPVKVGDTLYLCNGVNTVYALDAETGRTRWRFDPKINLEGVSSRHCRGVTYFADPALKVCPTRIFVATLDARLIAVDAENGKPCGDFGVNGAVDLRRGMGDILPGYYYVTSPPTLVRGKLVLGGWVLDNQMHGEPPGVIRAYDARTGAFSWGWDVGRTWTSEPGPGTSYTRGTPNSWSLMSADEKLGLVYFPTGNATPDYWGGHRTPEMGRFSTSVVAVDAETGATRWSFQTVHHDVWDYDVASQPTLVDLRQADGSIAPALIQATKQGEIFVLDRRTGKPLKRVEEKPVPGRALNGDQLSPTQPFSVEMPSFRGPELRESDMWGLTPLDQLWCRIRFRQARYEGVFTPPGLSPSIQYPGYLGGVNWGGVSIDPERQLLIANHSRLATFVRLVPRREADRIGVKPKGLGAPAKAEGVRTLGLKPPVNYISAQEGGPYASEAGPFMSPFKVPCAKPPYGGIAAVDLRTGKTVWSKPVGTARDSGPFGTPTGLPIPMGNINQGGALTTRSGLIFLGATQERSFRAFDLASGRTLWEARLPAGGQATPMSYWSDKSGRQFVLITAGGSRLLESGMGDYVVAYALPKASAR